MSLTSLSTLYTTYSTAATITLDSDAVGSDLSISLMNFLGVDSPVLQPSSGSAFTTTTVTYDSTTDILKIEGQFETFISVTGALSLTDIDVTLYLFDITVNGWSERHCLFITDTIPAGSGTTAFTPLNLLKCYTPSAAAPGFVGSATTGALLSALVFEENELLFSSIDYTNPSYATQICPITLSTGSGLLSHIPTKSTIHQGFTFRATPTVNSTLLSNLGIHITFPTLTLIIQPTYSSYELVTTFALSKVSLSVGSFTFAMTSISLSFSLLSASMVYPSISIGGTVKLGSASAVNYLMSLSLGSKSVSVTFTGFPDFAHLESALKGSSSFNLESQISGSLPIGQSTVTSALGSIQIQSLSINASYGSKWNISYMSLNVKTSKPVTFIKDVISIQPSVNIQLWQPFVSTQRTYQLQVGGLWTLGSGSTASLLSTTMAKSNSDFTLYAELANGSSMNVSNLFTSIIPSGTVGDAIKKNFPQITILDLEVTADFTSKIYEAEIDAASDWSVTLPGMTTPLLTFTQLELFLSYQGGTGGGLQELSITGWLTFAGANLQISGDFDPDAGWTIRGSVAPQQISLTNLITKIGLKSTSYTDLPTVGKGVDPMTITVNGLYAQYQKGVQTDKNTTPATQFSFFASLDTNIPILTDKLILDNVAIQFEYSKSAGTKTGEDKPTVIWSAQTHATFNIYNKSNTKITSIFLQATGTKADGFTFSGGSAPGQSIPIGTIFLALADQFDLSGSLPSALSNFVVDSVLLTYVPNTKDFTFTCVCGVATDENSSESLQTSISIALTHEEVDGKSKFTETFSGVIDIDGYEFEIDIESEDTGTGASETKSSAVVGIFDNKEEKPIHIHDLIAFFSKDIASIIPSSFALVVKDVFFVRFSETTGSTTFSGFIVGADIDLTLNLNDLPLIGKKLPSNATMGVSQFKLLVSSQNFTTTQLTTVNTLLNKHNIELPTQPVNSDDSSSSDTNEGLLPKGLSLAGIVQVGELKKPILLTTGGQAPDKDKKANTSNSSSGATGNQSQASTTTNSATEKESSASTTPPASKAKKDHGAQWIPIEKTIGPIHLGRIGARYQDGVLAFMLDASLSMGPLDVELEGLTFGSPIDHFDPYFDLYGLVIDFQKPPALEIGGGLVKADPPPPNVIYEYDGAIIIKTKPISIIALGSYAKMMNGDPSFFMYVAINGLKIGPAFFLVTGLAAGLGINRKLVVPEIDKMDDFPLINEVLHSTPPSKSPTSSTSNKDQMKSDRETLLNELEKLKKYVPPEAGEFFIGVGLKFTVIKIVDAFALAVVQFGHEFKVDLLGRMFIKYPPAGNGGGDKLLVNVTVDMHAYFYPEEGILGFEVDIHEGSYIYSEMCHISGRMALKSWFSGQYEGDFVFVLGGYHRLFKVPDNYPSRDWLKPLSLYWRLNDDFYVKGSFYFALTPRALMAGGNLEANFQVPHFRAYFHLYADFIVFYKPLFYDMTAGIDIEATVGIWTPFGDIDIDISLHADIHVWGPDFSAKAHVSICGIGFSIEFGAGASQLPPIPWSEFKTSYLPKPDKIFTIVCENGLIAKLKDEEGVEWWLVNKKTFSVAINSTIPITNAVFLSDDNTKTIVATGNSFGILPMRVDPNDGHSQLNISIKADDEDIDADTFAFQPVIKNIPAGLWGNASTSTLDSPQVVSDMLGGLQIVPGKPPKPGETFPVPIENLKFDSFNVKEAFSWEETYEFKASSTTTFATALGGITGNDSTYKSVLGDLLDTTPTYTKCTIDTTLYLDEPKVGIIS